MKKESPATECEKGSVDRERSSVRQSGNARRCLILASVQITVEARKVAGRNLHSEAMTRKKHVAGGPEVNGELVHFARREQGRPRAGFAVAGTDDTVG
jgi:hypothetical protein